MRSIVSMKWATVFVLIAGWTTSGDAIAQRTVTLTNANPPLVIPITAAPVELNNKVVTIPCAVNAQGACPIGSASTPPAVSFSCSGCATARVGQAVSLSWNSSPTEVCFAGGTGPAATSWAGVQNTSGIGRSLLFTAPGSYSLTLKCYGGSGSTELRTVSASVSS